MEGVEGAGAIRAPRFSAEERSALLAQQALLEQQALALGIRADSSGLGDLSVQQHQADPPEPVYSLEEPISVEGFKDEYLGLDPLPELMEENLSLGDFQSEDSDGGPSSAAYSDRAQAEEALGTRKLDRSSLASGSLSVAESLVSEVFAHAFPSEQSVKVAALGEPDGAGQETGSTGECKVDTAFLQAREGMADTAPFCGVYSGYTPQNTRVSNAEQAASGTLPQSSSQSAVVYDSVQPDPESQHHEAEDQLHMNRGSNGFNSGMPEKLEQEQQEPQAQDLQVQEDSELNVDTDVVMAYTDDSVRHFLQAMELNATLDTFEREWEDRASPSSSLQRVSGRASASQWNQPVPLADSANSLPTPRTGQIASLQEQLQAAHSALADARVLVSQREQAEADALAASASAQQEAAEAVAAAEQVAKNARAQATEAIQHARAAADAAERNARELHALQLQRQQLQEQVDQAQSALQQMAAAAASPVELALQPASPTLPQPQSQPQSPPQSPSQFQPQSQPQSPPQSQPPSQLARRSQTPTACNSPASGRISRLSTPKKVAVASATAPRAQAKDRIKSVTPGGSELRQSSAKLASKQPLLPLPTGQGEVLSFEAEPANVGSLWLLCTLHAHSKAVASVAVHPSKPIAVTSSDDCTWRMWHLPTCQRIMSGDGHTGWVASTAFHPQGTHLASASGDRSIKLWSFAKQQCTATYKGHTQAVWAVSWHHEGSFVASCSLDQTLRVWDATSGRSRQILRGHTDSVNDVNWQANSGCLVSASADRSVCVWDARSGLPELKFLGHQATCNRAAFSPQGSTIASCDSAGVVRLWDMRNMSELHTVGLSPAGKAANSCKFDASGTVLAVATDDSKVVCLDANSMQVIKELPGHSGMVHDATFSSKNAGLLSVGADGMLRIWGSNSEA